MFIEILTCYTCIVMFKRLVPLKQVEKKLGRLRGDENEGGREVLSLKEVEDLLNELRREN